LKSLTTSGSYLAARHASVERDASSAATFYRSALRTDPKNNELMDRAFIRRSPMAIFDEAVKLADRILTIDKSNRVARLVVGRARSEAEEIRHRQININQSIRGPITDLVATLLSGWASYGAGDTKAAVANIDKLTGPEWYPIFKDLHSGHDPRTRRQGQRRRIRLERAYKLDDSMLRVADDYCALAVAQQGRGGCVRDSTKPSTRNCRGTRWCLKAFATPRPARNCRRWSIRRRPAAPKRCTASAPR